MSGKACSPEHLGRFVWWLKFWVRRTDIAAISEVITLRVGRGHINAHLWGLSHFLSINRSDLGVEKDVSILADLDGCMREVMGRRGRSLFRCQAACLTGGEVGRKR